MTFLRGYISVILTAADIDCQTGGSKNSKNQIPEAKQILNTNIETLNKSEIQSIKQIQKTKRLTKYTETCNNGEVHASV
jgi:hypothetical protein